MNYSTRINHYYKNNGGANFPHLQQMAELRRNQRAEIGRRHVMAHYAATLVRFCCHLAHPDQRRNISDTPWNRDPRALLLTKNVTGSCTSPSYWCVRMKETRPTDRIRLFVLTLRMCLLESYKSVTTTTFSKVWTFSSLRIRPMSSSSKTFDRFVLVTVHPPYFSINFTKGSFPRLLMAVVLRQEL